MNIISRLLNSFSIRTPKQPTTEKGYPRQDSTVFGMVSRIDPNSQEPVFETIGLNRNKPSFLQRLVYFFTRKLPEGIPPKQKLSSTENTMHDKPRAYMTDE